MCAPSAVGLYPGTGPLPVVASSFYCASQLVEESAHFGQIIKNKYLKATERSHPDKN